MSDYKLIATSAEVWAVIKARHHDDLVPMSSFSDPDGTFNGGSGERGRMETSYGFRGADYPMMEARTTWRIVPGDYKRHDETHEYWLCIPSKGDE